MINAQELTKKFDDTIALDSLTTQIERGSIYGLIGSNGSGKSTFLRLLAGVYKPDGGTIQVDGEQVFENNKVKGKTFFVADELFYLSQSSMEDMARLIANVYSTWSWERYEQLCGMFPIPRKKKLQTFSKGMKRQAAIILAIASCPDYLLLDEAFDGLDPIIRGALKKILADDVAQKNTTVIISSHNLRELEDLCDHVGLLHQGRILFQKEIDELKLGFCKVQVAFKPMVEEEILRQKLDIMQMEARGSLLSLVVRGSSEEALEKLDEYSPVFAEALPLTLEEVFIHEMEANGYDYNNVLF